MSALPQPLEARLEPMDIARLDAVCAVEQLAYSHPWSRANFIDSLAAGYRCQCIVAPTLPAARGSLPPEGALAAWGRPGGGSVAPTLPAARGSLDESPPEAATLQPVHARAGGHGAAGFSPEGALAAWGRPGGGSGVAPTLPAAGPSGSDTLIGYFVAMKGVDEVHLLNLTVAPAFQRQGWAPLLLEALGGWSRGQGARWLWLEVREGNQRALAVYERHGFRRVGVRKAYYPAAANQRENAIVMSLRLDEPASAWGALA